MPQTALTQCLTRRLVAPRTAHLVCHRWDLTILLALLFTATMLPFEVAFAPNVQTTPLPFVINRIVDAVYICDGKDLSSPPSSPLALPLSLSTSIYISPLHRLSQPDPFLPSLAPAVLINFVTPFRQSPKSGGRWVRYTGIEHFTWLRQHTCPCHAPTSHRVYI